MSVTWYTWLEQARDISVSREVLDRIARVLRLNEAEIEYLNVLAGRAAAAPPSGVAVVDPRVRRLVNILNPNPAYVIDAWWDIVACNTAYESLLGGLDRLPQGQRNVMWLLFAEERSGLFLDWTQDARLLVGQLRTHRAQHPDDPRGKALVAALNAESDTFMRLWKENGVGRHVPSCKRFDHPMVGRLDLDYLKLLTADTGHALVAFMPTTEASAAKLVKLSESKKLEDPCG